MDNSSMLSFESKANAKRTSKTTIDEAYACTKDANTTSKSRASETATSVLTLSQLGGCNTLIPRVQSRYYDIYMKRKYPQIYTLSISTCKNQSTKVRGAFYIPTKEYNYKVITGADTIL